MNDERECDLRKHVVKSASPKTLNRISSTTSEIRHRGGAYLIVHTVANRCVPDLPGGQPIFVFQQCRLSNRVVAESTFFWTTCIGCNDFFLAVWAGVMCNFVTQASMTKPLFGDDNQMRFRNLLGDLRFHAERVTRL